MKGHSLLVMRKRGQAEYLILVLVVVIAILGLVLVLRGKATGATVGLAPGAVQSGLVRQDFKEQTPHRTTPGNALCRLPNGQTHRNDCDGVPGQVKNGAICSGCGLECIPDQSPCTNVGGFDPLCNGGLCVSGPFGGVCRSCDPCASDGVCNPACATDPDCGPVCAGLNEPCSKDTPCCNENPVCFGGVCVACLPDNAVGCSGGAACCSGFCDTSQSANGQCQPSCGVFGNSCTDNSQCCEGLVCNPVISGGQCDPCGNGVLDLGEQCDPPQSGICNDDCTTV